MGLYALSPSISGLFHIAHLIIFCLNGAHVIVLYYILIVHLLGYLGSFYYLDIVNNTYMNICVHVFVWTPVFSLDEHISMNACIGHMTPFYLKFEQPSVVRFSFTIASHWVSMLFLVFHLLFPHVGTPKRRWLFEFFLFNLLDFGGSATLLPNKSHTQRNLLLLINAQPYLGLFLVGFS